jgi:AraC-like DNA-binding protein
MSDFSLFSLLTAILGFAVSAVLFFSPERNWRTNFYLGLCFSIISYRSMGMFLIQNHLLQNNFLAGSVSFIYYLIPPAYYLYIKRVVKDEQDFSRNDMWHLLIPILAFAMLIYYYFAGFIQTGVWRLPIFNTKFDDPVPFPLYLQMGQHAIIITCITMVYLIMSWSLRIKYLKKQQAEHTQRKVVRNWIDSLLITSTILSTILFIAVIINWVSNKTILNLDIPRLNLLRSIVLIFFFTRVIIKRDLLFGMPSINTKLPDIELIGHTLTDTSITSKTTAVVNNNQVQAQPGRNYQEKNNTVYIDDMGWVKKLELETPGEGSLNIEQDKVNFYIEQINKLMESEPFVNPDFDMKYISSNLQIPHYHIEYIFRYYNKYNFNEYRNLLRVKHVLRDLGSGFHEHHTIESLGIKAGFSSRSSFFRVFKSFTGKTPKQYVEDLD